MPNRRIVSWTSLVAFLALAALPARSENLEEVTYLLPAPAAQIAFAPWMLAQQRGYYAREGLKVTFQPGRGGVDVAKMVGAGNAIVGGAFGDTPIVVRANGVPVKAVALLGGRSMMALVVHEDSKITRPKDLKGKTVTVMTYADAGYYALLGMLASGGLNKSDVDIQAAGPAGTWQLFAARKADGMAAVPEWIAEVRQAGAKVRIMPAYEYTKSMAQAIVSSDEAIRKHPDLIRKLVRATLRGFKDIMTDPKAAVRDYVAAMPMYRGREAFVEETFRLYNTHVYPGQEVFGLMDADRLGALQKFYFEQGIVQKEVPVSELFTNQFIQ
ncbi:MAG: ABC transporter substrate-binding protein [Deltaproteobacteria bacterium]|nr:ABC transporter substrate-binding protein [Deltaproteobacteria bacterium]